MPYRAIVRRELAGLLSVLSHPARLAIIDALEGGERDVSALAAHAGVSHSAASQQLAVLRAHRLVQERRDGRHVLYHLTAPGLAAWLAEGLSFVETEGQLALEVHEAVKTARRQRTRSRRQAEGRA
jgi:DNA-binding transcriptional ArsR family regulator